MEGPGSPSIPQASERMSSLRESAADRSEPACSSADRMGWGRGPEVLVGSSGCNPQGSSGEPGAGGLSTPYHSLGARPFANLGQPSATWGAKGPGPQV